MTPVKDAEVGPQPKWLALKETGVHRGKHHAYFATPLGAGTTELRPGMAICGRYVDVHPSGQGLLWSGVSLRDACAKCCFLFLERYPAGMMI